jgi:hypothetical protein
MKDTQFGNLPDELRCTALAKGTGNRCRKPAMSGLEVCRTHGGATPAALAKSRAAREATRMARRSIAPLDESDPEGRGDNALAYEIRRTVSWIRYCEAQIERLGQVRLREATPAELAQYASEARDPLADALSGGVSEIEDTHGEERGERTELHREKWTAGVNVWEEKLRWNRAHLKDLTRQWINAGFEQKRLEILERTVDLFERTLDGILRDLGHNPHDAEVRRILRDRLSKMQESPKELDS